MKTQQKYKRWINIAFIYAIKKGDNNNPFPCIDVADHMYSLAV